MSSAPSSGYFRHLNGRIQSFVIHTGPTEDHSETILDRKWQNEATAYRKGLAKLDMVNRDRDTSLHTTGLGIKLESDLGASSLITENDVDVEANQDRNGLSLRVSPASTDGLFVTPVSSPRSLNISTEQQLPFSPSQSIYRSTAQSTVQSTVQNESLPHRKDRSKNKSSQPAYAAVYRRLWRNKMPFRQD